MSILTSTFLMGLVLLGILLLAGRYRNWRRAPEGRLVSEEPITDVFHSPTTWMIVFVAIAFLFTAGAIAVASEISLPGVGAQLGMIVGAGVGLVIVAYTVLGTYFSAKARGFKTAQAVGLSSGVLGVLFLVAITIRLLLS